MRALRGGDAEVHSAALSYPRDSDVRTDGVPDVRGQLHADRELAGVVHDGVIPTAIAVTASGGVRVAYNQGVWASNQTPIKAQDNRLLVWSCDSNCLAAAGWSGTVIGNSLDGEEGTNGRA